MRPAEARAIQETLRAHLACIPLACSPRTLGGADVAYSKDMEHLCAAVVVLDAETDTLLDYAYACSPVRFPYIPGLLAFREGPAILRAFYGLTQPPDIMFFDGHGTFHPRAFGIASHMGVVMDLPAIGCAKRPFLCDIPMPGIQRGSWTIQCLSPLQQAACVRTRDNVRPLYVSPGHKITLEEAIEWVLKTTGDFRIPRPLRRAHILAKEVLRNQPAHSSYRA